MQLQDIPAIEFDFTKFEHIGEEECMCDLARDAADPLDHRAFRILGSLAINGTLFHVEGIAVRREEEGMQLAACADWEERLERFSACYDPDGGWTTVEHDGHDYVLFLEAYS